MATHSETNGPMTDQYSLEQATLRADAAERARDRVMCAVFRIDELHHEAGDDCSCGKRITQCSEFSALNFIRTTYYAWENRQIERYKSGKPHGLPLDHPLGRQFQGRAWEWKGQPSTRGRS